MTNSTIIILVLGLVVGPSWVTACWWTGCQPNNWAVKGCGQYGRVERGKQSCRDNRGVAGSRYNCCERGGGGGGSGGRGNLVTFDQFRRAVTSNQYPSPSRQQYNSFSKYLRTLGKISSKQEAAMALAQFLHESDGLRAKKEYACQQTSCPGSYRTPGCDAPGKFYYGRGYIQLSWCYNYREASNDIFRDNRLVRDPDQVANNEDIAWQTALWFWGKKVHNAAGVQQGRFGASTKVINGGLECGGKQHSGPAKRFRFYGNVRAAFGLSGRGDPSGC